MRNTIKKLFGRKSSRSPGAIEKSPTSGNELSSRYIEFWRTKTWEEHLTELQQTPEDWNTGVVEFSALIYDQMGCPEDLVKDEVIDIGDSALQYVIEYAKQEWRFGGVKIAHDIKNLDVPSSTGPNARNDGERFGMGWVITDGDIIELKEQFFLNGGRLRCAFTSDFYKYLRSNTDILSFEIIGGQASAEDEGPPPESSPLPTFAHAIGGREGYFLRQIGSSQTFYTPEERLTRFCLIVGLYFPHL